MAKNSKFILLAIVPQVMEEVLEEIRSILTKDQIIITPAAGISIN